jgi:hypothetical protein
VARDTDVTTDQEDSPYPPASPVVEPRSDLGGALQIVGGCIPHGGILGHQSRRPSSTFTYEAAPGERRGESESEQNAPPHIA